MFSINDKSLQKIRIEQFTPSVVDGAKLVYSFLVPLEVPISADDQTVRVTAYDDTYFVAFDLMRADDGVSVGLSIEKSKVKPLWPGQYMPDNLVIRFKEKS